MNLRDAYRKLRTVGIHRVESIKWPQRRLTLMEALRMVLAAVLRKLPWSK